MLPFNSPYWVHAQCSGAIPPFLKTFNSPYWVLVIAPVNPTSWIEVFQFPLLGSRAQYVRLNRKGEITFNSPYWVLAQQFPSKLYTTLYFQFPLLGSEINYVVHSHVYSIFQFPLLGSL